MDTASLEGHWRLESFYMEQAGGQRAYPFGPDPVGYLTYWQGRFQANLMASGRRPFGSGDLANPAPDDAVPPSGSTSGTPAATTSTGGKYRTWLRSRRFRTGWVAPRRGWLPGRTIGSC